MLDLLDAIVQHGGGIAGEDGDATLFEDGTSIDFGGVSLVGYTVSSTLTSLVTGGTVSPITTSVTDAAAAVVAVSLTDTQTASLAAGTYGWRLDWIAPGGVQRTALQGVVEVVR